MDTQYIQIVVNENHNSMNSGHTRYIKLSLAVLVTSVVVHKNESQLQSGASGGRAVCG